MLNLIWLWLQYSCTARFALCSYTHVHCSQSFTVKHYFVGTWFDTYIPEKWETLNLRRITCRIISFWTFLWRTSNLILRPIKKSSLKLKKCKWYSCRSFEVKKGWGMHSDVTVLKLKSNESESAKKNWGFLDYFFFYRSLKLVHLQLQSLGYTSHRRKKDLPRCVFPYHFYQVMYSTSINKINSTYSSAVH